MKSKKVMVMSAVLLLLLGAVLFIRGSAYIRAKKLSLIFSEQIGSESMDDIQLTIFFMDPFALTDIPVTVDSIVRSSSATKTVVSSHDLAKHMDLFRQIDLNNLIPVWIKTSIDARIYYVLESEKNGMLVDVAMWGGWHDRSIFVNGFEVRENDAFYEMIIPFLSEDEAKRLNVVRGLVSPEDVYKLN